MMGGGFRQMGHNQFLGDKPRLCNGKAFTDVLGLDLHPARKDRMGAAASSGGFKF
jgi:hypothetical protein